MVWTVNLAGESATLTFLFTDIESSTRLWEAEPVRMAAALAHHDRLCETATAIHGGRVVKMTGDGMLAVFDEPVAALSSALELQRGIESVAVEHGVPIKIRCGVHAGSAEERAGDYFGTAVNRTARIMSAAHGGQIVFSQDVADLGPVCLPAGADMTPLGRVRLRDLAAPVSLWQLLHPDIRAAFPALRSLDTTPNNLPQQLTSFIGREGEMTEARALLSRGRLITLTGSGGCGKTRLMLQLAADVLESYPDGVWLIELAPLADPTSVPPSVATVLGLRERPGTSVTQTLLEHLESRHTLLLLDNAEHLLTSCAELVDAVLRRCPQVVIMVSSREALGIAGEVSYRVPSLSMPDATRDVTAKSLAACESARLFVERARSRQPRFDVTDQNAPALASICVRLDGIPLAIELAAARVRSLSVAELNQRLDERFRLLTGGSRTALPRQQTLRSAIDWSFDLLNTREQALFCRLAVFAGGWTLEAAEQVCSGDAIAAEDVIDLVDSLASKSLAVAEERDGVMRFRLLETVRQYARERLLESRAVNRWRDRHLAYFVEFAEHGFAISLGAAETQWLARVQTEHDNLRAALAWAAAPEGDASRGLRIAAVLWRFWLVRGYIDEGRCWLSGLLGSTTPEASEMRFFALNGAGVLAWRQGDYSAAEAFHQQGLTLARELGNRERISDGLGNLGVTAAQRGDYSRARILMTECLEIKRELGDQPGIAATLHNLGLIAREQGDHQSARMLCEEGLGIFRQMNHQRRAGGMLCTLGLIALDIGNFDAARECYEEGLAICRRAEDKEGTAMALHGLGDLAREARDYENARALYEESVAIRREVGARRGLAAVLADLAGLAIDQADMTGALSLLRESLDIHRKLGEGRGIATSLEGLGRVSAATKAPVIAARIWGATEALRKVLGTPLPPYEQARLDRAIAGARAVMSDDPAFDASWHEGGKMTEEQAIGYALQQLDIDCSTNVRCPEHGNDS